MVGLLCSRDSKAAVAEGAGLSILRFSDGINCMAATKKEVICGLLDKTIRVLERQSGKLLHTLSGHTDHIWSLDHNQRYLVSGSWDATVKIWCLSSWNLVHDFVHPDAKEISGVKIQGKLVFIGCLSGSLAILEETQIGQFQLKHILSENYGGIYSIAVTHDLIVTSHAKETPTLRLWKLSRSDVEPSDLIEDKSSQSIIWNLFLSPPFVLVCHDNEMVDLYHLQSKSCLRSLKHEAKVLDAKMQDGLIAVGCQYGLLVFWELQKILHADLGVLDMNFCAAIINEHSAAIANVVFHNGELISADYDGITIRRKLKRHSKLKPFIGDKRT